MKKRQDSPLPDAAAVDIAEVTADLPGVEERIRAEQLVVVTRDGEAVFALVDTEFLFELLALVDALGDPKGRRAVLEGIDEFNKTFNAAPRKNRRK